MNKFRFHHLAIPHTVTHHDYVACAYTQKVLKFAKMMTERGHEVIHYGHEDSDVICTEHVTVTDNAVLDKAYGSHDWRRHQFKHNVFDHANVTFVQRTIPEIRKRAQQYDFVLANWGFGHQSICNEVEKLGVIPVEPGIGYTSGHFSDWRAYESHAVRNVCEGSASPQRWYSRVIPNYFDTQDFTYNAVKDDYVLFLGRVTELKGVSTCVQATQHAGVKLKIAGQGRLSDLGYTTTPAHVEEIGYADKETRRELMSRARALIIATTYLEPFGGVVVEALLSGTPIITPHFGAFAEINQHGRTGFLCHTMRDYVRAIQNISAIGPETCRQRGLEYSLERVAPQFERWFSDIQECYTGQGWTAV
jgi:glycosyltransferase involved in cell wall biosynthesis